MGTAFSNPNRRICSVMLSSGVFFAPHHFAPPSLSPTLKGGDGGAERGVEFVGNFKFMNNSDYICGGDSTRSNRMICTMPKHGSLIVLALFSSVFLLPESVVAQYFIHFPVVQPAVLQADAGPNHTVTSGTQVTLGGAQAAIGGTAPYTFLWSPGTGLSDPHAANPTFLASTSCAFVLSVSDQNLCTTTDTVQVTVGIGYPEAEPGAVPFVIWPNPVQHRQLVIRWPALTGSARIRIYAADGRLVMETTLHAPETTIDLQEAGITTGLFTLVAVSTSVFRTKLLVP